MKVCRFFLLSLLLLHFPRLAQAEVGSCASLKMAKDFFEVGTSPKEECAVLGIRLDVSRCVDSKINRPIQILCREDSARASVETQSKRYEVEIKRIVGPSGSIFWFADKETLKEAKISRAGSGHKSAAFKRPSSSVASQPDKVAKADAPPDRDIASIPKNDPTPKPGNPSKDKCTLFDPTPTALMRDFNANRPGSINTPFTVDAGHYQLELEFLNYSTNSTGGVTTKQLIYPSPNIRVGVTNTSEVQIKFTPQITQWVKNTDGSEQNSSGVGDVNLFYKINMLANDGGAIGWAIMPGVKVPTNTNGMGNNRLEPSLLIPFSLTLPNDWGVSFMPEIDINKNALDGGYHTEFNYPIAVGHHLLGPVDGYVEFGTHSSNQANTPMSMYIGSGIAYKVGKDMQFDIEDNSGLNSASPSVNLILGWTIRY